MSTQGASRALVASEFVGVFAALRVHADIAKQLVAELLSGRRPPNDELRHHLSQTLDGYEQALRREVNVRTAMTIRERSGGVASLDDTLESPEARAAFHFALAGAPTIDDALVLALVAFRKFVSLFGELLQQLLDDGQPSLKTLPEHAQTLATAAELAAHHENGWRAYFALVAPSGVSLPEQASRQ